MVPQVIVAVTDRDVERDASEKLLEIGLDMVLGTARAQELGPRNRGLDLDLAAVVRRLRPYLALRRPEFYE